MAQDKLPPLISDEEFARLLKQREQVERPAHDTWDNAGVRPPQRRPTDGLPECTIEQQFPHVALKLVAIWPSEACAQYIKDLAVVDREERQGFPVEVLEDLMLLYAINEMHLRGSAPGRPAKKPRANDHPGRGRR